MAKLTGIVICTVVVFGICTARSIICKWAFFDLPWFLDEEQIVPELPEEADNPIDEKAVEREMLNKERDSAEEEEMNNNAEEGLDSSNRQSM